MSDKLQKILFQQADARGEFVELDSAWQAMLMHRSYPAPVVRLLGEMTAAAILLSGSIKFDGATVMQIHGDGPIRLLVVECDNNMQIRATAKLNDDIEIDDSANLADLINVHGNTADKITVRMRVDIRKRCFQKPLKYSGSHIVYGLISSLVGRVCQNPLKQCTNGNGNG